MMMVLLFICHDCLSARGNTLPGQFAGYAHEPGATETAAIC